jgi:hypothetical protein
MSTSWNQAALREPGRRIDRTVNSDYPGQVAPSWENRTVLLDARLHC